jgi:predicted metal-dependent hydrolase
MEYKVIRRKLKHARINVNDAQQVKLIIPENFSENEIIDLIEMKKEWIEDKIKKLSIKSDSISLDKNKILYLGNSIDTPSTDLLSWYKTQASAYIKNRVKEIAATHIIPFNSIFIRDTKHKWGNCSIKNNLSFNWRLILMPPDIIDYVIIHELCHIKVLKHTNAFWLRVQNLCPNYRSHSEWLHIHGKAYYDLADKISFLHDDNLHK